MANSSTSIGNRFYSHYLKRIQNFLIVLKLLFNKSVFVLKYVHTEHNDEKTLNYS